VSKAILGSLIILGTFFIWVGSAIGQDELVTAGWLPYEYLGLKNVPIHTHGDSLYILAGDTSSTGVYFKHENSNWRNLGGGYSDIHEPKYYEFYLDQRGFPVVYNRYDSTLSYLRNSSYLSFNCPGRPVLDCRDNIHIIWRGTSDTLQYYYGYSTDSLRSFDALDTLPQSPNFLRLISSPDDSIVCALFFNSETQMLTKYLAINGQAIDFPNPTELISCDIWVLRPYDITLNNSGDIYFITNVRNDGISGSHRAWTEDYGYRYLEFATDDVNDCPAFEFSFGASDNEVLLIKNGTPPNGGDVEFFATLDGGNTWFRSTYTIPSRFAKYYGSTTRNYVSVIDYTYFRSYGADNVYYRSIPRDSIFNNLTAIDENTAVLPNKIMLSNYPNPFNSQTTISFSLANDCQARLSIYDITGRLVAKISDEKMQASQHNVIWDGHNFEGKTLSSGVYFARLEAGNSVYNHRLLLLK
jgi:hypothetical protein